MDEIKIEEALERSEEEKEEQEQQESEKTVQDSYSSYSDGKSIFIMIAVLVGVFALFLGGFTLYNNFSLTGSAVSVNQLHEDNLAGDIGDEEEGYVYNGYSFVKADGLWWTEVLVRNMNLHIPLHFGPKEVEFIPVKGTAVPKFNRGENIYVAIDPKVADKYYTLATSELSFNIAKGVNRNPVGSCTEDNYICENRTIVSCDNTQDLPVVEMALAKEASIDVSGTCIKVSGNGWDIVKAVDRLLYKWYGIMD